MIKLLHFLHHFEQNKDELKEASLSTNIFKGNTDEQIEKAVALNPSTFEDLQNSPVAR